MANISSIATLTIDQLQKIIQTRVINEFKDKNAVNEIPSFMIWGSPGIGKSDSLKQVAENIAKEMNREVVFKDIRLLLFNPVDLRGLPTFDEKRESAKWLKPEDFDLDDSDNVLNVLLFDELPNASESVQAAAYQLILNRKIGQQALPNNVIVLAAGNKTTDKTGARKMLKALANRFTHIELVADLDSWKKWALNNGVDSHIIGFLNFKPSALFDFNGNDDNVAFPTPRSWVMADGHLKYLGINDGFPFIAGSVGVGTATEFRAFYRLEKKLPKVSDILDGKEVEVPTAPDLLYALSSALVYDGVKLIDVAPNGLVKSIKEKELVNLSAYINKLPVEFATVTIADMLKVKGMGTALLKIPEFKEWCKKCKKYIV